MLTIHDLQVHFDVDGDEDAAVFGRMFADHIRRWSQARETERCRRRDMERERSLGDRDAAAGEVELVSITPVSAAAQGVRAHLEIVRPRDPTPIPLCFNPTEYQISKANTFAEIPIPGLETPLIQYVRGDSEKLSVEALVDTSDTLEDVRVPYVRETARADVDQPAGARAAAGGVRLGPAACSPACWRTWPSATCCSRRTGSRCGPS